MKRKKKPITGPLGCPGWMASYADMFTIMMVFFVLMFAFSTLDDAKLQDFVVSFQNALDSSRFLPIPQGGDIFVDQGAAILPHLEIPPPAGAEGDEGGIGPDNPTDFLGIEGSGDTVGDMLNTFMTYMAQGQPGEDELLDDLQGGRYPVEVGEGFIRININDDHADAGVFFNPGQAMLTPAARTALNELGPILAAFAEDGHGIIIEGHTDNVPISTQHFPSNWTLSGARASSVVEHLVVNFGIDVQMIAGLGRGEYFPVADNNTVDGRAQNRRVEIKVFTQEMTSGGAVAGWFAIPGTIPGAR